MSTIAQFDQNDHATSAGWATVWLRPYRHVPWRRQIRCRLLGHIYPEAAPIPPNGHSPSNCARCPRCRTLLLWKVVGQHRYGGMSRDVAELAGRNPKEIRA